MAGEPRHEGQEGVVTPPLDAAGIHELFKGQLEQGVQGVTAAEATVLSVQGEVDEAGHAVKAAAEAALQTGRRLHSAESVVTGEKAKLDATRKSAVSALHASGRFPAAETFLEQTVIEGGTAEDAQSVLDRTGKLNRYLGKEDARQQLIVLGSLLTRASFKGYEAYGTGISIVDLSPDSQGPIGLDARSKRHHLTVSNISRVSHFASLLDGMRSTADTSKADRVIAGDPLGVKFVGTERKLAKLFQSQDLSAYTYNDGAFKIDSRDPDDSLPNAIIFGEAARMVTKMLANSEFLRTAVFASLAHGSLALEAQAIDKLPEDSEALEQAQEAFKSSVQFYTRKIIETRLQVGRSSLNTEPPTDPLFSRKVQAYLGVHDTDLEHYITETLAPYVKVHDPVLHTYIQVNGAHSGYSSNDMCHLIKRDFAGAGLDLYDQTVMANVRDAVRLSAFQERLTAPFDRNRVGRSLRKRLEEATTSLEEKSRQNRGLAGRH